MRVILIFIDGIGVGEFDRNKNPCANEQLSIFNNFWDYPRKIEIPYQGIVKSIDATLGISGLPQSATGQTTLLTGINASQKLGKHLSGFPNKKLREILASESILIKYKKSGKKPAFINAYRPLFFEVGPEKLIRRLSVTSVANWTAGLKFFSIEDVAAYRAIYHDFTNSDLVQKDFKLEPFSPQMAGEILAQSSAQYDFCLYEYFKTDSAGHAQNIDEAVKLLKHLEIFVISMLKRVDLNNTLVIITSDHGNIEDLSVKTHTMNPVQLIVWGISAEKFVSEVNSIRDISNVLNKMCLLT